MQGFFMTPADLNCLARLLVRILPTSGSNLIGVFTL